MNISNLDKCIKTQDSKWYPVISDISIRSSCVLLLFGTWVAYVLMIILFYTLIKDITNIVLVSKEK